MREWMKGVLLSLGIAVGLLCPARASAEDCNHNGIPDDRDIRYGRSSDVNENGIPDECETVTKIYRSNSVNLTIPDGDAEGVTDTLQALNEGDLVDAYLSVRINHRFLSELTIDLDHNLTSVRLWDRQCPDQADMEVIFDEEGVPVECATPVKGRYQPVGSLWEFTGAEAFGDWSLTVADHSDINPEYTGTVLNWALAVVTPLEGSHGDPDDDCNRNVVPDEEDIANGTSQDCDENGVPDECDRSTEYYHSFVNRSFPDNDPQGHTDTIEVDQGGVVSKVEVEVDVKHKNLGDVVIDLTHGDVAIRLWDQQCHDRSNLEVTFDDDAPDISCPRRVEGTFQPTELLAAFNGQGAAGDWSLTVADVVPGNSPSKNKFVHWALRVTTVPAPCEGDDGGEGDGGGLGPVAGSMPNIVFILTDDQRFDSIPGVAPDYIPADVMPNLEAELLDKGVHFRQAFSSNPVCCPARAAILAGGFYSHHTGVMTNKEPNGAASKFYDGKSLALMMAAKGYRVGLLGKYMNGYKDLEGEDMDGKRVRPGRYVPTGWNGMWVTPVRTGDWYTYDLTVGINTGMAGFPTSGLDLPRDLSDLPDFMDDAVAEGFPQAVADYVESLDFDNLPYLGLLEEQIALDFLQDAMDNHAGQPFFLFMAVDPPHGPATPEPQDQDLYPDFIYRARAWGEEDLSDKPLEVQDEGHFQDYYDGTIFFEDTRNPDEFFGDQLRCLRTLDRTIEALVDKLEGPNSPIPDQTVYVFASDHGILWGEHKLFKKSKPYEEAIRTPLIIRMPGGTKKIVNQRVLMDLDVPATLLKLAGYTDNELKNVIKTDGISLLEVMNNVNAKGRAAVMVQNFTNAKFREKSMWGVWRSQRWKYTDYETFEEEIYDLNADPFELESLHDSNDQQVIDQKAQMAAKLAQNRGLTIKDSDWVGTGLPNGEVGASYSVQLDAVGGNPPYSWFIETFDPQDFPDEPPVDCASGVGLPPGLTVAPSGLISGTPTQAGCWAMWFRVEDSSVSPHHGGPQSLIEAATITIDP